MGSQRVRENWATNIPTDRVKARSLTCLMAKRIAFFFMNLNSALVLENYVVKQGKILFDILQKALRNNKNKSLRTWSVKWEWTTRKVRWAQLGDVSRTLTEKAMAPHSSTLAWKIPWAEEPGRLQSMGSLRVGHDWATSLSLFTFMHCKRKWQPTPVFLPGESQGWGSLVGCRLWGRTELDTTEAT